MSPLPDLHNAFHTLAPRDSKIEKPTDPDGLVLEAWAQGYMLVMGYWQGFFILFNPPIYAWWLSVAAIPLNASWCLHNVIAWMKLRPFLSKTWSRIFIGTVILSFPYWIVEIYANFAFFHNVNKVFLKTRPWEALCRDPWWVIAAFILMYNIKSKYDLSITQIVRISPRFAVMLGAMLLSIIFIILDILSVTSVLSNALPVGINPFWKLSFVFKCLTDSVVLDDFKTALDRLRAFKISRLGSFAADPDDARSKSHREHVNNANNWGEPPKGGNAIPITDLPQMPSPDGDYIHSQWKTPQHPGAKPTSNEKYVARSGSRDRDFEENAVDPLNQIEESPRRGASEAHILHDRDSWGAQRSTGGSSDLEDYAEAVRQMTQDSKPRHNVGVARSGIVGPERNPHADFKQSFIDGAETNGMDSNELSYGYVRHFAGAIGYICHLNDFVQLRWTCQHYYMVLDNLFLEIDGNDGGNDPSVQYLKVPLHSQEGEVDEDNNYAGNHEAGLKQKPTLGSTEPWNENDEVDRPFGYDDAYGEENFFE